MDYPLQLRFSDTTTSNYSDVKMKQHIEDLTNETANEDRGICRFSFLIFSRLIPKKIEFLTSETAEIATQIRSVDVSYPLSQPFLISIEDLSII